MRLSCAALVLIVFMLIFSIFVANVANLINVDNHLSQKLARESEDGVRWSEKRQQEELHMDDSANHLMWFVQISDLHISIFAEQQRIEQLREFAKVSLDAIRPLVVLASGDLTDAKDPDFLGSRQYKREWEIYADIVKDVMAKNQTTWLDIRGNHDNFNIPFEDSSLNYYRKYSVQGAKHRRSYLKQIKKGNEIYSFLAVDACLDPGPKRPFNFIGVLSENETQHIIDLAKEARRLGGNYTIWFGHYPTSCILSSGSGSVGLRRIIGHFDESYVYLCGHLHTLGGLLPQMYTMQHDGFLELELGDWKAIRRFRIAAIDHGMFSFIDVHHNEWPIVLITNPKEVLYNLPMREQSGVQLASTHIRLLAFSTVAIVSCRIRLNGGEWSPCTQVNNNLFVLKWEPHLYGRGIHTLEVEVVDASERMKHVRQQFSLDGSRLSFQLLARLVLMSDASKIFQILFGLVMSVCVIPLCFFRGWHALCAAQRIHRPRIAWAPARNAIRKFWILSTINRLTLPLIGYCLYLACGPWSIGEVIDGYTGIIFVWGIYVNGGFLPGSLTYLYGFFQLLFCQVPLICIFSNLVDAKYCALVGVSQSGRQCLFKKIIHAPFIIIIVVEIILAIFFWHAYGTIAFLVGPFRTWSVLLNISLWYMARNLPEQCLTSAILVWSPPEQRKTQVNLNDH